MNLLLIKGKKHPLGYTSTYADGSKWRKVSDGPSKWVRVKASPKSVVKKESKRAARREKRDALSAKVDEAIEQAEYDGGEMTEGDVARVRLGFQKLLRQSYGKITTLRRKLSNPDLTPAKRAMYEKYLDELQRARRRRKVGRIKEPSHYSLKKDQAPYRALVKRTAEVFNLFALAKDPDGNVIYDDFTGVPTVLMTTKLDSNSRPEKNSKGEYIKYPVMQSEIDKGGRVVWRRSTDLDDQLAIRLETAAATQEGREPDLSQWEYPLLVEGAGLAEGTVVSRRPHVETLPGGAEKKEKDMKKLKLYRRMIAAGRKMTDEQKREFVSLHERHFLPLESPETAKELEHQQEEASELDTPPHGDAVKDAEKTHVSAEKLEQESRDRLQLLMDVADQKVDSAFGSDEEVNHLDSLQEELKYLSDLAESLSNKPPAERRSSRVRIVAPPDHEDAGGVKYVSYQDLYETLPGMIKKLQGDIKEVNFLKQGASGSAVAADQVKKATKKSNTKSSKTKKSLWIAR